MNTTTSDRLTDAEVERRMPALRLIDDADIRREVVQLTAEAPDYFWTAPATYGNHHHPLCRKERGLWLHTLMLMPTIRRLHPSYAKRGIVDWDDADLLYASAVLHDQRKEGHQDRGNGGSLDDHDLVMADVVREQSTLPESVAEMVESHMGPWYEGPEPESPLADLLHAADMIASTADVTCHIPEPIPDELEDLVLDDGTAQSQLEDYDDA